MASEVLGRWSRSKFHMQLNHASAKREPKFFDIMTSEPHQNIFFWGAQWYQRFNTNSGGSIISEPHNNIGGSVMLSEPHQKQLGGGADDIWAPPKYWGGGGRLKDISAPPKYGGAQWYQSPAKIFGGLNDIRDPPNILGGGVNYI